MKKYLFLLVLISFSYGISAQSGDVGSEVINPNPNNITLAETDIHELNDNIFNASLNLIIFDLMGNVVEQSNIQYLKDLNPKILIYTYWDSKGQLVKTKKVFVSE